MSTFRSIIRIALKRLLAQRGLALATALGLIVAIALTIGIPLYADAVHFRLLRETVIGEDQVVEGTPLPFRFRYVGARDGPLQWEDLQAINAYFDGPAFATLRLPRQSLTAFYKTNIFRVQPAGARPSAGGNSTWISFATVSDLQDNIILWDGAYPAATGAGRWSVVEVLIHKQTAESLGWQVGDTFLASRAGASLPVRIAGIWTPANARAGFWSAPLGELALVPAETFSGRVSAAMNDEIYLGVWLMNLDGDRLHVGDVPGLLGRIETLQTQAAGILPNLVMDDSPVESLEAYRAGVPELTFLMFAYSIPLVVLLLAFIGLVVGLYVNQLRNQIAVLRSRGASRLQVTGIAALEGVLLGALALALGAWLGIGIARLIGQASSFLDFSAPPDLRIDLTSQTLRIGLGAILVALAAMLAPTFDAARHTILTYKQERARLLRPAWWQRIWLDGLLLLPTGYGFYVLRQQGSLALESGAAGYDLFQNPLLFLAPALGLIALTLFLARLLPLIMTGLAWLASKTNSVSLLLAARQLSRSPGLFTAPLMLLTLTLSLSSFTASLAQTLDRHLTAQTFYQVGAELRLSERGIETGAQANSGLARWFFKPVERHLEIPGVQAASRLGRYQVVIPFSPPVQGAFLGVDRYTFPSVAYWPDSFASQSLGALMNELALHPDGVLVARELLESHDLEIGDQITLIITAYNETTYGSAVIVGVVDMFPTWYPEEGTLVVGNLKTFFENAGMEYPYEVWLNTTPDADPRQIVRTVKGLTLALEPGADESLVVSDGLHIRVDDWASAPMNIQAEQRRPQRQGLFGLLSVGFISAALLTVLGFLLYALFSFRRRFIELGVLRAVGLSIWQMSILLAWELASLIVVGMGAGTALGVLVSRWFIPYMQVGTQVAERFPPFLVVIAWQDILRIYGLFGLLFLGALGGLTAMLVRMKIFQAVKLGETS